MWIFFCLLFTGINTWSAAVVDPMNMEQEKFLIRRYAAELKRLGVSDEMIESPILYAIWRTGHRLDELTRERKQNSGPEIQSEIGRTARVYLKGEEQFRQTEHVAVPISIYTLLTIDSINEINRQANHKQDCLDLF